MITYTKIIPWQLFLVFISCIIEQCCARIMVMLKNVVV